MPYANRDHRLDYLKQYRENNKALAKIGLEHLQSKAEPTEFEQKLLMFYHLPKGGNNEQATKS